MNDGSVRDFQRRTTQFLAGKMFEGLSLLGPVLVDADELGDGSGLEIRSEVDGGQATELDIELCFNVVDIVQTLCDHDAHAGDVIAVPGRRRRSAHRMAH